MAFAEFLRSNGVLCGPGHGDITGDFVSREAWFGTVAYLLKFIEIEEADRVLQEKATNSRAFGDVAVRMGFMTKEEVATVLRFQNLPITFGDLVLAARVLDRDGIHDQLTAFGSLKLAG